MDWVNAVIQGILTGRAVRAVRHRPVARLRRHAVRQPGPRRPGHPGRLPHAVDVGRRRRRLLAVDGDRRGRDVRASATWAQRGLFNFTLGEDPLPGILVSFGVGIVIQNALQEHYTATDRSIDLGPILTKSITITDDISHRPGSRCSRWSWPSWCSSRCSCSSRARRSAGPSGPPPTIPQTAQLMGINDKRLYGVAMAIAFAAVALAGFFRGARTSFSPSSGGGILLFAFEAVVIGGLGSLWGTLVGGIVLGVAQGVGNQASIGWDLLAGHLVFLFVLRASDPTEACRRHQCQDGGVQSERSGGCGTLPRSTSPGSTRHRDWPSPPRLFFALFPLWGSDSTQLTLVQIFYYLSLAQMWNLLAGYAGPGDRGPAGLRGRRRVHALRAERAAQRRPVRRHRPRRRAGGRRCPSRSPCSRSASRAATSPSARG